MGNTVRIDELADAVMEGLVEYADLAADEVKGAVKRAVAAVRQDIADHAPKRTGLMGKAGRFGIRGRRRILWRLRCIRGIGTGWRICWNSAMRSAAAGVCRGRRILLRRRLRRCGCLSRKLKGLLGVRCDGGIACYSE